MMRFLTGVVFALAFVGRPRLRTRHLRPSWSPENRHSLREARRRPSPADERLAPIGATPATRAKPRIKWTLPAPLVASDFTAPPLPAGRTAGELWLQDEVCCRLTAEARRPTPSRPDGDLAGAASFGAGSRAGRDPELACRSPPPGAPDAKWAAIARPCRGVAPTRAVFESEAGVAWRDRHAAQGADSRRPISSPSMVIIRPAADVERGPRPDPHPDRLRLPGRPAQGPGGRAGASAARPVRSPRPRGRPGSLGLDPPRPAEPAGPNGWWRAVFALLGGWSRLMPCVFPSLR